MAKPQESFFLLSDKTRDRPQVNLVPLKDFHGFVKQ